ncbi:MAG: hypothetical protein LBV67_07070 [Streptococcaceae bacterium]|jgi:capsular polysaccharide biosynthesis protein|nr:hypothetical protein [Streptococcaceae bacterium]
MKKLKDYEINYHVLIEHGEIITTNKQTAELMKGKYDIVEYFEINEVKQIMRDFVIDEIGVTMSTNQLRINKNKLEKFLEDGELLI